MVRQGIGALPAPRRLPRAFALIFGLALSACAPTIAKMGDARVPPAILGDHYRTRDGLDLAMQEWEAEKPRAVVVALHGMNDYANAFAMPGSWWKGQGITTYAYDQRGFGRSPDRGIWAGDRAMIDDVRDLVGLVRARHPGVPVFLLGESMGGAVALASVADGVTVDGLILVSPALWGWSTLPFGNRVVLWFAAHTIRWAAFTGEDLGVQASDNVEMLRALARDPNVIRKTRADAIYGLAGLMERGYKGAARVRVPALILLGAHDEVVPREPVLEAAKTMSPPPRIVLYPNGWHMLTRDLQREVVWRDIAAFLKDRDAALPSQRAGS